MSERPTERASKARWDHSTVSSNPAASGYQSLCKKREIKMMEYSGAEELRNIEFAAPRYNNFLASTFAQILKNFGIVNGERVLDFGAGIGTLAVPLRDKFNFEIDCVEIDPMQKNILEAENFKSHKNCQEITYKYRAVYTSNVLEHIEDDLGALTELRQITTQQNAILIIYVPALQILFSPLDKKLGHWRRYNKNTLSKVVKDSGWQISHISYVDCLGIIGWTLQKYISIFTKSTSPSPKLVKLYDTYIFPLSRVLDRAFMQKLVGKNLLLIAQKTS
jgi:hypothetical protein